MYITDDLGTKLASSVDISDFVKAHMMPGIVGALNVNLQTEGALYSKGD